MSGNETIVTSQKELDKIPLDHDGRIIIKFGTPDDRAIVRKRYRCPVEAHGNSSVVAYGNSSVEAYGNSSVEAWENSSVVAYGNSSVVAWENSSVEARGSAQVTDRTWTHQIKASGNTRIVYDLRTPEEYAKHYELEMDGRTVKLFKAVHKRGGRYWADHDIDFEYVIGETAVADGLDTDQTASCGAGIHAAYKEWCVTFGKAWPDLAVLEVEMELDSIIVPVNGEGNVRAREAKVLRDVPLEECGLLGQMLAKRRKEA